MGKEKICFQFYDEAQAVMNGSVGKRKLNLNILTRFTLEQSNR